MCEKKFPGLSILGREKKKEAKKNNSITQLAPIFRKKSVCMKNFFGTYRKSAS